MTATGPVSRDEVEEIKSELADTRAMVKDLHDALMVAQPGQEKSLLERMATVTLNVESGARTMRNFGAGARAVTLILALLAAIGISFRFGVDVRGLGE